MKCQQCGNSVPAEETYCGLCGAQVLPVPLTLFVDSFASLDALPIPQLAETGHGLGLELAEHTEPKPLTPQTDDPGGSPGAAEQAAPAGQDEAGVGYEDRSEERPGGVTAAWEGAKPAARAVEPEPPARGPQSRQPTFSTGSTVSDVEPIRRTEAFGVDSTPPESKFDTGKTIVDLTMPGPMVGLPPDRDPDLQDLIVATVARGGQGPEAEAAAVAEKHGPELTDDGPDAILGDVTPAREESEPGEAVAVEQAAETGGERLSTDPALSTLVDPEELAPSGESPAVEHDPEGKTSPEGLLAVVRPPTLPAQLLLQEPEGGSELEPSLSDIQPSPRGHAGTEVDLGTYVEATSPEGPGVGGGQSEDDLSGDLTEVETRAVPEDQIAADADDDDEQSASFDATVQPDAPEGPAGEDAATSPEEPAANVPTGDPASGAVGWSSDPAPTPSPDEAGFFPPPGVGQAPGIPPEAVTASERAGTSAATELDIPAPPEPSPEGLPRQPAEVGTDPDIPAGDPASNFHVLPTSWRTAADGEGVGIGVCLDERFRLIQYLGGEASGGVYRAYDDKLEEEVAIKVLVLPSKADRESRERFLREARLARKLRHPAIIGVLEFGEDGPVPYLVMPLVEGRSLRELLDERRQGFELSEAMPWIKRIAEALDAVHEAGIVHRDLQPGNVLVDSRGLANLTDFGLARHGGPSSFTRESKPLGEFSYAAPEALQAPRDVDQRADIYSFGVLLFELLTGVLPFDEVNPVRLAMAHVGNPPPSAHDLRPRLPRAVDRVIERCMAKDPGDRYPRATEAAGELSALLRPDRETRVLIIEPDEEERDALCEMFELASIATDLTADAAAALELAESSAYDLVLCNYVMQGGGALWLLQRLQDRAEQGLAPPPVVVLSSSPSEAEGTLVRASGADNYLRKPLSLRDFRSLQRRFGLGELSARGRKEEGRRR